VKSYAVEAFVLRLRPLGEADRILTLFSRERGKLHAVAKGSRKTQSKFGARLDFFNRVSLALHAGRSLDVITGAQTVIDVQSRDAWERLVEPDAFALASYVAEVIDALSEPDLAVPDLYELLCEVQAAIGQGVAPGILAPAIDVRLLGALGLAPELDACARCGTQLGNRPLAGGCGRLSPASGGLVCRRCSIEAAQIGAGGNADVQLSASGAELRALRSLRETPLHALREHPEIAGLRRLTQPFVEYQLGRRSKALAVGDAGRRRASRSGAAS
jgi:DNA repair protein RecO (recombination protein O)